MSKFYFKSRLAVVIIFTVAILTGYVAALYKIQIYDSEIPVEEALAPVVVTRRVETLRAKRGDILDRNGKLLVSSRPSYNIVLTRAAILATSAPNDILRDVIRLVSESGAGYNDDLPVSMASPFEYDPSMTGTQRGRLDKYFEYFGIKPEITASDFIVWLRTHYKIPYTTGITDARMIIGVRWELELRAILNITPYSFVADAPPELIARVAERALPGVSVETSTVREYHTEWAAHILGYVNRIPPEKAEYFKELGYPADAIVGREGVEAAFEQYLHGVDGTRTVRLSENGAVVDIVSETPPVAGQNVYLTIDIDVQETAERALAELIADINREREEEDRERDDGIKTALAESGAVVLADPNTGEILALASYPTYDPATLLANYTQVANDPQKPLFNRATSGTFSPGSTFKLVTGYAGLTMGVINDTTRIYCNGLFEKYNTEKNGWFLARCWIYPITGDGHKSETLLGAIRDSCNVFFYTVGDNVGLTGMVKAARDFGFGQKTGIEIGEATGIVATEEYKLSKNLGPWVAGDTVLGAIGQGYNLVTPTQMANYVSTIANGGERNTMTLLHSVKSFDYLATNYTHVPEIVQTLEHPEYIAQLQQGMREVVRNGAAKSAFLGFPVTVAAKTGTVQTSGSDINNGVFIAYAPYVNPEIAVSVVVEKGGSGARIMDVAKAVMTKYFEKSAKLPVVGEGSLNP